MNKTPISENDIGLAVIFSSTTKHCNPNYHNSLINFQTQSSITESHASGILAPETEVLQQFKIMSQLILTIKMYIVVLLFYFRS